MVILIGSHGTGKTTLLREYKSKYGAKISDGVSRPISRCRKPLDLSLYAQQMLINELTFFNFDFNRENVPDLMITRSPIDAIAYSEALGFNDFGQACREKWKERKKDDITYIYLPIEFELEDDGIRYTDLSFQKDIDKRLIDLMREYKLPFQTVTGSVEDRVEQLHHLLQ